MSLIYYIPNLQALSLDENTMGDVAFESFCYRTETDIKKSRFITSLGHAPNKEAAKVFIGRIRSEFPDATHNCWAYVACPPGSTANIGQSDDGEPYGTAGKPMLSQLLHGQVGEIVAVVTRYFGGTKLGTGGLVRAYQGCVADALTGLPVREKSFPVQLELIIDYAGASRMYGLLPRYQGHIIAEQMEEKVTFVLELPQDAVEDFMRAARNVTDGKASMTLLMPKE